MRLLAAAVILAALWAAGVLTGVAIGARWIGGAE